MTVAAPRRRRKRRPRRSGPQAADLLAWYDRHRRDLPWRAPPGERPDPYRVWLSEIMLQQTGVKAVAPYFARFLARWPNVRALAGAPLDDVLRLWAGLGYYARARNLHACAQAVVERHGGLFPRSEAELGKLPGIGRYTAAAIAAIAFDAPAAAIDGNAERVVARLFAVEQQLPAAKAVVRRHAESLLPAVRAGDFAQALMDLGATLCTPRKPACELCPWRDDCTGCRGGHPETFPIKAPKKEGRLRRGAAFVLSRADGSVLLRTRAPKGLLGGMTEVPTTAWTPDFAGDAVAVAPRLSAARPRWRRIPGVVTHVFTHFPLELVVYAATVAGNTPAPAGMRWVARAGLAGEALPNLMRKVPVHALG
jgi:A/G-specific adenine glycosylase